MIIFDLDLTLVDSRPVLAHQRARRWGAVFSMVPKIQPYDGIAALLARLHAGSVPIAIVTSSPDQYCKRIVDHQAWRVDAIVGFHDTRRRKPHPDPIELALRRLDGSAKSAVHVGDRPEDTAAARAAGVFSVGAAWGSLDPEALAASEPDLMCGSVADLDSWLVRRFGIGKGGSAGDVGRRGPVGGGPAR